MNEIDERAAAIKLLRQNGLNGPADDLELLSSVEQEATANGFDDEIAWVDDESRQD